MSSNGLGFGDKQIKSNTGNISPFTMGLLVVMVVILLIVACPTLYKASMNRLDILNDSDYNQVQVSSDRSINLNIFSKPEKDLVGTWQAFKGPDTFIFTFRDDDLCVLRGILFNISGKYKVKDGKIYITFLETDETMELPYIISGDELITEPGTDQQLNFHRVEME